MKFRMVDKTCLYYRSKKIESNKKINEVCISPLRYGEKLELEDIEGFENHYSCDCDNHKQCFWNSSGSRLEGFAKNK